jgi:hypothetical protein
MIYAIHDILMTYFDGWLASAFAAIIFCGGRSFAFQQSSFIFYFTWYLDEVDEKYPFENAIALLSKITFPCSKI